MSIVLRLVSFGDSCLLEDSTAPSRESPSAPGTLTGIGAFRAPESEHPRDLRTFRKRVRATILGGLCAYWPDALVLLIHAGPKSPGARVELLAGKLGLEVAAQSSLLTGADIPVVPVVTRTDGQRQIVVGRARRGEFLQIPTDGSIVLEAGSLQASPPRRLIAEAQL